MTGNHVDLSAGVLYADRSLFVRAVAPGLVEALEAAREAYDAAEPAFQERAATWQRNAGAIRRHPKSSYAKALAVAAAAVAAKLEALIASGAVIYAGFPAGQLDGEPVPIPLEALAGRRPRGSRLKIRGVEFFDVRLYRAQGLKGPGRPPGRTRAPRDADGRLRAWLADVDHTDKTIPEITAELVALHPEIGTWWAESTALKRVGALLPARHNDFRD